MFKEYRFTNPHSIENGKYKELLDYLFQECDVLSFCELGSYQLWFQAENFMKKIEKFRIKSIQVKEWHGWFSPLITCTGSTDFDTYIIVHFYKCCEELKNILLESTTDLFFTKYDSYYNHTIDFSILQDICFFKNNKIFVVTLTHEGMCNFYPQSDFDLQFIKDMLKGTYCEIELQHSKSYYSIYNYNYNYNCIDITKYGF
ncbi:MAG: hypothetical protein FWF57_00210 [Defluviitaleaceae bacterium]|nr:hypothetical protein [Defluviitaleaceae bacterium]